MVFDRFLFLFDFDVEVGDRETKEQEATQTNKSTRKGHRIQTHKRTVSDKRSFLRREEQTDNVITQRKKITHFTITLENLQLNTSREQTLLGKKNGALGNYARKYFTVLPPKSLLKPARPTLPSPESPRLSPFCILKGRRPTIAKLIYSRNYATF